MLNISINNAMTQFLTLFVIILVVFGVSFILINLRQVVTGQNFRGTCASNNPMLKNKIGECGVCGKKADEDCKMPESELQNLKG